MTYTSAAHREGPWWVIQNDQVPGALSQVAQLDEATAAQREAIAFVADVPADSVDVVIRQIASPPPFGSSLPQEDAAS